MANHPMQRRPTPDNLMPPSPGSSLAWIGQKFRAYFHPLRHRLQRDPYYRFQSYQELAIAAQWGFRLDVNRATVDHWLRLPGLSIHQARTLVSLSQAGVQFHCLEDIAAALGIPEELLNPLAPALEFRYYDPVQVARCPVNQATLAQLSKVPGITPELAQVIVQERHHRGPFRTLVEFQQRLQIPGDVLGQLMHCLKF